MKAIIENVMEQLTMADLHHALSLISNTDPEVVVSALDKVLSGKTNGFDKIWHRECMELAKQRKRVGAIKVCRDYTGWSLSEAKDYVDGRWGQYYLNADQLTR